jgi:hypothetical protein
LKIAKLVYYKQSPYKNLYLNIRKKSRIPNQVYFDWAAEVSDCYDSECDRPDCIEEGICKNLVRKIEKEKKKKLEKKCNS